MAAPGQCRDCNQSIVWARSMVREDGWIALDPSPDTDLGTVRKRHVYENGHHKPPVVYGEVLAGDALHRALADGERLWMQHRHNCTAHKPLNPKPAHIQLNLPVRKSTSPTRRR